VTGSCLAGYASKINAKRFESAIRRYSKWLAAVEAGQVQRRNNLATSTLSLCYTHGYFWPPNYVHACCLDTHKLVWPRDPTGWSRVKQFTQPKAICLLGRAEVYWRHASVPLDGPGKLRNVSNQAGTQS
jgi:hypothetical protein